MLYVLRCTQSLLVEEGSSLVIPRYLSLLVYEFMQGRRKLLDAQMYKVHVEADMHLRKRERWRIFPGKPE